MSDDATTALTFQEMVASINDELRVDVTAKVLGLKGPVEGLCTLAAILAYIVAVSVDEEASAVSNIDNMCVFTKKLTSILMQKRDEKDSTDITKH